MVSKVRGRFADFEGTVTIAPEPLDSAVEVSVQLASIDTRDAGRDEHLRGADFFDVDQHPTMTFRSTGVRELGQGHYALDGELSLREITKPLVLDVRFDGTRSRPVGRRAGRLHRHRRDRP